MSFLKRSVLIIICLFFLARFILSCALPRIENTQLTIMGDLEGIHTVQELEKHDAVSEITLKTSLIALKEIVFEASTDPYSKSNSLSDDVTFQGPYIIDLLNGKREPVPEACVTAQPGLAALESGVYDRIELQMAIATDPMIPRECILWHKTVYLAGEVACVEGQKPFIFWDNVPERFTIESACPFMIEPSELSAIFLVFPLEKFFNNVDLCAAEETEGTILIDFQHNSAMQRLIRSNIQSYANLGEDLDSNKTLSQEDCVSE